MNANNKREEKPFEKFLKLESQAALDKLTPKEETELKVLRMTFSSLASPQTLRSGHGDLDASLATLEAYAKEVAQFPFRGDMGVGSSKAMPVRYEHMGPIAGCASLLIQALKGAYIDLVVAFIDAPAREHISLLEKSLLADGNEINRRTEQTLRKKYPEFYRLLGRKEVFRRMVDLLREATAMDLEKLSPDMSLSNELYLESLELLDLISKLEDEFSIKIEDEEYCGIEMTVGELAKILSNKLKL